MRIPKRLPDVAHAKPGRTALYRFYDSRGALLYIGITNSPKHRFAQHASNPGNEWWHAAAYHRLHWYDTRQQALRAEYVSIRTEHPIHNKMHNRYWRSASRYRAPSRIRGPAVATLAGAILLGGAWGGAWVVDLPMQIMMVAFTFLAACLLWARVTE